jgi:hypothetical protein
MLKTLGIQFHVSPQRKKRVKISREVIHNLKKVNRLSYINQWEYAGKIEYKKCKFSEFVYVTSKRRTTIEKDEIEKIWYSQIGFHTHPGLGEYYDNTTDDTQISTTLPSASDFEAYIKGYPYMQSNIICDAHGYYVIDIINSMDRGALPLPEAVNDYMLKLRRTPFMRITAFSEDGCEYFNTTLKHWKRQINSTIRKDLLLNFGISIRYYGYNDEPPVITLLEDN